MKRLLILFVAISIALSVNEICSAETQYEVLTQYVSELQKYPNDNAIREKIIKHVQSMKPAPAVPEEAERFMARGVGAIETAKDQNGFKDAVTEFEKAALHAPWLPDAYYNLGIAQDKAGLYPEAIKSLKLYLLAAPDAADVKEVKSLIYKVEYKQEAAVKEAKAAAEVKKDLNGVWWLYWDTGVRSDRYYRFEVKGNEVLGYTITGRLDFRGNLSGRNLRGKSSVWHAKPDNLECIVSEDFGEMNCRQSDPYYPSHPATTYSLRRE
jgi:tetratricopeptide (TPR) repeat protein